MGDLDLIPGLGRSPGEGKGYPLQYSGLENSMDYTVQGVGKSWTWLSHFHFHFHMCYRTVRNEHCDSENFNKVPFKNKILLKIKYLTFYKIIYTQSSWFSAEIIDDIMLVDGKEHLNSSYPLEMTDLGGWWNWLGCLIKCTVRYRILPFLRPLIVAEVVIRLISLHGWKFYVYCKVLGKKSRPLKYFFLYTTKTQCYV